MEEFLSYHSVSDYHAMVTVLKLNQIRVNSYPGQLVPGRYEEEI